LLLVDTGVSVADRLCPDAEILVNDEEEKLNTDSNFVETTFITWPGI
jgi:hypothetical protein